MKLTQKYRPDSLDDIIGQDDLIESLKDTAQNKDTVPDLLLLGPPGNGKTSIAHAFAQEVDLPLQEYNASDERGIDTIRDKIKSQAFSSGERMILLDEADSLTKDAQQALRRIMEKSNVPFVLTGNQSSKIIPAIKSRTADFHLDPLGRDELRKIILKVLMGEGFEKEEIKEKKKVIDMLIERVRGDARKAVNYIETLFSQEMELTPANLETLFPKKIGKDLIELAYQGNFEEAKKRLENGDVDIEQLYDSIEELDVERYVKIKLFKDLGQVERNMQVGCSPKIQLTRFLSTAWIANHIPKEGGK